MILYQNYENFLCKWAPLHPPASFTTFYSVSWNHTTTPFLHPPWENPGNEPGLGFPTKRKNRFAKISHFSRPFLLHFRISFAHDICENFRFFEKFRFYLFWEKMRNFREIENKKISRKIRKIRQKIRVKNNGKISRKNAKMSLNVWIDWLIYIFS